MTNFNTNPRVYEEPVVTQTSGPVGGEEERHPSYAMIGASRVSSNGTVLFGSDFKHNAYITLRIKEAKVVRRLSNDWYHADRRELIEVSLSEAQWGALISSLNVGDGVPCTLKYRHDLGYVPQIPEPPERKEQFNKEMRETFQDAVNRLSEMEGVLRDAKITEKLRNELMGHIRMAKQEIQSNAHYVEDQFAEHVENTVEHAKTEIHGYMTNMIQRTGLEALQNGALPLQIEGKDNVIDG